VWIDCAIHFSQKVWSFSTLAVVTKKVRLSEGNLSLLIRWLGLLPVLLCFAASGFAQIEFEGLDSDQGSLQDGETQNWGQLLGQTLSFYARGDFETGSNEKWDVSNATPSELGFNGKTIAAVSFARPVKFQFSDSTKLVLDAYERIICSKLKRFQTEFHCNRRIYFVMHGHHQMSMAQFKVRIC
jgi:hypothetical protein